MRATRLLWIVLLLTTAAGVAIIAFPTFYVMPFKAQRPEVLAWALLARTHAAQVTAVTLALAALLSTLIVARTGRRRAIQSGLAVLLLAPLALAAWFARQNHFEWMFNPLPARNYVAASKASFVLPDDVVMAVDVKSDAVAYPIRQLAYHHLVNDVVAGEPIVATY